MFKLRIGFTYFFIDDTEMPTAVNSQQSTLTSHALFVKIRYEGHPYKIFANASVLFSRRANLV
jgi:hypothetical protein